jgi:hypothetical protein
MGRGQMFALGRNVWRTGPFQMTVDIERAGICYELAKACQPLPGCRIDIELYDPFDARGLIEVQREIARFTKYVQGAVTVNGDRVSVDPATLKWTTVTSDAYFNLRAAEGYGDIQLYNLGVFVCELPAYRWGLSGTVVSRKQLDVNFARNEVIQSCPVFKRIRAVLAEATDRNIAKKTALSTEERRSLITQLISGEARLFEHKTPQVFVDASGHGWSLTSIQRLRSNRAWTLTPANKIPHSFAPPSREADQVLQEKRCLVLDQAIREWFEHSGDPAHFFEDIDAYDLSRFMAYVPFASIRPQGDPASLHLIPPTDQTPRERLILGALAHGNSPILSALHSLGHVVDPRVLRLGEGGGVRAWTDGETYIAFARLYLQKAATSLRGFAKLCMTLLHEYAHLGPDSAEHGHDPAFYRLFHDASEATADAAQAAYHTYLVQLQRQQRRLAKAHELPLALDAERQALEQTLGVEPPLVVEPNPAFEEISVAADTRPIPGTDRA